MTGSHAFADIARLQALLASGEESAVGIVSSALDRIEAIDATLRAFVTVDRAGALRRARELDRLPPAERGPLHAIPVAVKDLVDTAGLRTTYGSALFADHVPEDDDWVVRRLRASGAVVVGKTNTPEFGFGAVCSNEVAGATRNPHDIRLTSGGSSGGSAVAVAAGMVPIAHGTDFGGSVRTPASFCGVVALRPTPGAIAAPTRALAWDRLSTHGVLARSVADCSRIFDALSGPHRDDPTSFDPTPARGASGLRLAQTPDFGTATLARAVRTMFAEAVDRIEAGFGPVRPARIDGAEGDAAFRTLRAAHVYHTYGSLLEKEGARLSPTARWNIQAGREIAARDYLRAEAGRARLYRVFMDVFENADILLAPAASVLPWPVEHGEVEAIDGQATADVLAYLAPTYLVSLVGCPVLALPAPLSSASALPFGIQLVGRPGSDRSLLAFGALVEESGFRSVRPYPFPTR